MKTIWDLKTKFSKWKYLRDFKLKWRWDWKKLINQLENTEECLLNRLDQIEGRISELEGNIEKLNCYRKEYEKFQNTQKKHAGIVVHCEKTKLWIIDIDEEES